MGMFLQVFQSPIRNQSISSPNSDCESHNEPIGNVGLNQSEEMTEPVRSQKYPIFFAI
jgi:hypothetical protein